MSKARPFLDSTDVVGDTNELRVRFDRDGYLFIRGLLPVAVLDDLRQEFNKLLRGAGWIAADSPLDDALADLSAFAVEPEPAYQAVYNQLYGVPAFHALQHRPEFVNIMERLLDAPAMPHPRTIVRIMFPKKTAHTTPAHQDFIPVQGATDTVTAWVPLTDLPPEMGGLEIAAGSHRHGVFDFVPALGAGGMVITDSFDDAWVGGTFEQGDTLLFHSMTVHRGVPATGERLRLSVDYRFQRRADPITQASLEPHDRLVDWEQIYADWAPGQHQYFWRDWDLSITQYDMRYNEKRDSMAFELAANGDETALASLNRIVARDPDPDKKRRAVEAIESLNARSQ